MLRSPKGDLKGGIYKVFDVSQEGNFVAVGVRKPQNILLLRMYLRFQKMTSIMQITMNFRKRYLSSDHLGNIIVS